jgi:hypothetical protein
MMVWQEQADAFLRILGSSKNFDVHPSHIRYWRLRLFLALTISYISPNIEI